MMRKKLVVRPVLFRTFMKYSTQEWNVKKLLEVHKANQLELSPYYQRNDIWTLPAKKRLIDSIKIGYPLPAFFLNLKHDGVYDMVDGQQRTRALIGFVNRQFPGLDKELFEPSDPESLLSYKLTIVVIEDTEEQSVEDFYFRVNNYGSKLNRQETFKAQKANSIFLNMVENLASSEDFNSLNIFSDAATGRMIDIEFVSELVAQMKVGITDKKKAAGKLYDVIETEEEAQLLTSEFFAIIRILKSFNSIHPIQQTRYKQKNDFYTLFGFLRQVKDLREESLKQFYKVLVSIGKDVSPSNDDCFPLQDYAFNCVSQSNSESARTARLEFFNELLTNPLPELNTTQKEILSYYNLAHEPFFVQDYTTIDANQIIKAKHPNIAFEDEI